MGASEFSCARESKPCSRLRFSINALLVTVAVLAFAVLLIGRLILHSRYSRVAEIYGGSSGLAALRYADRVEAYRLGELPRDFNWQDAKVSDYPVTAGPIAIASSTARKLARILEDPESYGFDFAKSCVFRPGVRIDFTRGKNQLQVLFCFECDTLAGALNGEIVGGEDFDSARHVLIREIRSIFPDDAVINSLK
jgi:hypothetical protein